MLRYCLHTPSISEIMWVKNVRVNVVCGFFNEMIKRTYPEDFIKVVGSVWELPAK